MAKRSWVKSTVDFGGNVTSLWGLLPAAWQTFVTAGFTAVTAYFGFKEVGWAWAIFLSSGVLAFGMVTVFLSLRISQILGVFQRLTVAGFGISSIVLNDEDTEIDHLNLHCILRNDSQRPMFYKLKRAHASMERRGQASDAVDSNVIVIPAYGGIQSINFSTIEDIPFAKRKGPEGQLELEIDYGSSSDSLEFHLREVVQLGISIFSTTPVSKKNKNRRPSTPPPGPKQAQLFTQIKVLEHSRASK